MAYNKLRREISTLLANEEKTPVAQADIATKLESFYSFEDDGGGLKQCKDWIAFRDAALRDRGELIAAYRVLRKLLVTLGGPVVDARPVPVVADSATEPQATGTSAVVPALAAAMIGLAPMDMDPGDCNLAAPGPHQHDIG